MQSGVLLISAELEVSNPGSSCHAWWIVLVQQSRVHCIVLSVLCHTRGRHPLLTAPPPPSSPSRRRPAPTGMLHGDLNEQNLLVSADAEGRHHIAGLLDFGDSHRSALVFELALAIMYLMIDCPPEVPRLDVGGHALAGYRRHRALTEPELRVLKVSGKAVRTGGGLCGAGGARAVPIPRRVRFGAAIEYDMSRLRLGRRWISRARVPPVQHKFPPSWRCIGIRSHSK